MRRKKQVHPRTMKVDPNFQPYKLPEDYEIFPNGYFHFNISQMISDIESGKLDVKRSPINIKEFDKTHMEGVIHEDYMPEVKLGKPIILAEIRHDRYEVIDGHHRMEKARREGVASIEAYKVRGEQLCRYLTTTDSYIAYVNYWNEKLLDEF